MRRRVRFGQHLAAQNAVRYVAPASLDTSARVIGLLERLGVTSSICLTNVGRLDFLPTRIGEWSLSGGQGAGSLSVAGYLIAAVGTVHGRFFGISRTSTGLCRSRPRSSSRTLLWRHCWTHLNKGRSDAQPEVTKRVHA